MADLFTLDEFASYIQQDVDTSTATVVRRVASGWLMAATGLNVWPVPTPDDVWTWALELAAIAYRSPSGDVTSESIDDYVVMSDRARRKEILQAAATGYGGATTAQYAFPDVDWHWNAVTPSGVLTN
jgi:hypothetical protein